MGQGGPPQLEVGLECFTNPIISIVISCCIMLYLPQTIAQVMNQLSYLGAPLDLNVSTIKEASTRNAFRKQDL